MPWTTASADDSQATDLVPFDAVRSDSISDTRPRSALSSRGQDSLAQGIGERGEGIRIGETRTYVETLASKSSDGMKQRQRDTETHNASKPRRTP